MTSKGMFRGALVALLSLGACRPTPVGPGPDAQGGDGARDMGVSETAPGDVGLTDATDAAGDTTAVEAGVRTVTIRQLQDLNDPMHPAPNTIVNVDQPGMVALTPRLLVGSRRGDDTGRCHWAVWVGTGMTGDFSGIQVHELVSRGDAGDCFGTPPGRIPVDLVPGDRISMIANASYGEFCFGPSGTMPGMCREFEQTQLLISTREGAITRSGMGTAPMATPAAVGDLVAANGAPGPRTLALEGALVVVRNVRVITTMTTNDAGTFTDVSVVDPSDTMNTRRLDIEISNFRQTSCVRSYFTAQNGMTVPSITGVLLPQFGRWKIRIRDERDVEGLSCAGPDGGVPDAGWLDASIDVPLGG
jgi:hypothetical protein